MKLPLAYYGNPILRKKTARVEGIDDVLRQLVNDMEETMFAHNGIGIAAPQVHVSLALFLVNISKQIGPDEWIPGITSVFINPKIVEYSKEEWVRGEGCISIPEVYCKISRPLCIKVEATDINGERFTRDLSGLEARVFLHENDHINGVLHIDRIKGKEREEIEPLLRKIKKKYSSY